MRTGGVKRVQAKTRRRRLTKAELRVQIARDVIAQVKSRRLVAMRGNYGMVLLSSDEWDAWMNDHEPTDLRALLSGKRCEACALGSMFLAAVDRHDKIAMPPARADTFTRREETRYLSSFFSASQLDLIESAFESTNICEYTRCFQDTVQRATKMFLSRVRPRQRMIQIMQNIVDNEGTFRP
jgi:hypothetical protein